MIIIELVVFLAFCVFVLIPSGKIILDKSEIQLPFWGRFLRKIVVGLVVITLVGFLLGDDIQFQFSL